MMNFDFDVAAFAVALFNALYGAYFLISRPRKKEGRQRLIKKAALQALVGTSIILFLVLISPALRSVFGWIIVHVFSKTEATSLNSSLIKQYSFEKNSKVHILVAPFKEYGNSDKASKVGIILSDYIVTELTRNLSDSILQLEVRLLPEKLTPYIRNHDDAVWWGDTLNADIVVWGDISPPLFNFQEFFVIPNLTLVSSIRSFGSKIRLETVKGISSRPVGFPFPQQLLETPSQLALFLVGHSFYLKANYDQAIKSFEKAISYSFNLKVPYADNLYYYLGSAYFNKALSTGSILFTNKRNSDLEKAEKAFLMTLSINPQHVYALNGLGAVCAQQYQPDFKECLTFFQNVIKIDSTNFFAYGNLAFALLNLGEFDEALRLCEKQLEILHHYPEELHTQKISVLEKIALIYTNRREFSKAESLCLDVLKIAPEPQASRIYTILGYALWRQGKIDESHELFLKAHKKYPENPLITANLGGSYLEKEKYQEGLYYSKQVINHLSFESRIQMLFNIFGAYCIMRNKDSASVYFKLVQNYLAIPILSQDGLSMIEWIQHGDSPHNGFDQKMYADSLVHFFIDPYLSKLDKNKSHLKAVN